MKKIFLILMLLLIPTAYAQGLEIERIKVYVNDVREITLEDITENIEGGILEDINSADIIEIDMRFRNNWNNKIDELDIKGTIEDIDNGDNLVEKLESLTLDGEEELTKKLLFTIPSETRIDDYPMDIEITAQYENGTDVEFTVSFELDVISEDIERVSITDILKNMSDVCMEFIENTKSRDEYADKVEQLKYIKGGLEEQIKTCSANNSLLKTERESWENEKLNYIKISECNSQVEKTKEESKQDWFPLLVIGGLIWYFRRKKGEEEGIVKPRTGDVMK